MNFIIYLLLFSILLCENNHPVILIHGFLGWGRNEMPGYYYWGGHTDLESMLKEQFMPISLINSLQKAKAHIHLVIHWIQKQTWAH